MIDNPKTLVSLGARTLGAALLALATPATAQDMSAFSYGPVFDNFGRVADVEYDMPIPADTHLRVVFDLADPGEDGSVNRYLESAARFINMHARAGLPPEQVEVAIVVHGQAGYNLMGAQAYSAHFDGEENPNLPLIAALVDYGARIYLCGQSATGLGMDRNDLAPGVTMALSAMTAHALLQQEGYTLNPF